MNNVISLFYVNNLAAASNFDSVWPASYSTSFPRSVPHSWLVTKDNRDHGATSFDCYNHKTIKIKDINRDNGYANLDFY